MEELSERAYVEALFNAVQHKGKAQVMPVVGKLIALFRDVSPETVMKFATEAVEKVNGLDAATRENELRLRAPELLTREKKSKPKELRELEGAGQGFTVRLAPFPSGALHIGNVRMLILNDEYAKKYKGKLLLVFDDTIGSEEKLPTAESYDLIREGLEWLGVKWDAEYYKSDRLELFYSWAERLIVQGIAYVCLCDADTLRKNREKGIACSHRDQNVDVNLDLWGRMLDGSFAEGEAVLRAKTDISHSNPAFRDRVLCRISDREHPRVGRKYRVWPMLEFSWAVDDIELGMTHVIRGKDLVMEDMMERFIWDRLGIEGPRFEHFGLLRIKGVKISKSKSNKEVATGVYTGWDDPRTWSLQSLAARGFRPEAIRSFMVSLGMSLADIEVPVESIYAENRRLLEPVAKRYYFVDEPVSIEIENMDIQGEIESYLHPDRPEFGKRKLLPSNRVYISGRDFRKMRETEVRLKDFCNVMLEKKALFTGRENKNIQRIQWVPVEMAVEASVVMPDGTIADGYAEPASLEIKEGETVQFERFGFACLRRKADGLLFYFTH
ncbi:MAG: glutamate--tRNA ligase, partial [Methanomassiliicoccales archaeon]